MNKYKSLILAVIMAIVLTSISLLFITSKSDGPPKHYETLTFEYCGSISGEVAHTRECLHGQEIYPKNFVVYQSAEEAIAAGRRGCSYCLPVGFPK